MPPTYHPAPIPCAAHVAAYTAHKADTHRGQVNGRCATCTRYALTILAAARH